MLNLHDINFDDRIFYQFEIIIFSCWNIEECYHLLQFSWLYFVTRYLYKIIKVILVEKSFFQLFVTWKLSML